jgi:hypothetical protein
MQLLAITELGDTQNESLRTLADELGTTLYELRLLLNAGLPAVVLATVDGARAAAAKEALVRRRHRVVAVDRQEMTPSAEMTALRDFSFAPDALVASAAEPPERLAFADIGALVRATHRTSSTSVTETTERKLRPGMAIATGGLVLSGKVKKEVSTTTVAHDSVLYIFPRGLRGAFILRERLARYAGLGSKLHPTSLENFATATERLRQLAPHAAFDDRLKTARPIRGVGDGIEAADWYAHVIAKDLIQRPPGR